ncbi:MAG: hypothetical protein WB919_20030 [Candidatus Sulfotelmatobacter sp.]
MAVCLSALLCAEVPPVFSQQDPTTAGELLERYVQAIGGADRIAAITTFAKSAETSSDLGATRTYGTAVSQKNGQGTFEFYYKAPNLRFALITGNNEVLSVQGCDGALSWHIDRAGNKSEFKPKPDNEYECSGGYEPMPLVMPAPRLQLKLKGKKKVSGRFTWAIEVKDPKSEVTDVYYFDAENYLLVRSDAVMHDLSSRSFRSEILYSDYREVEGLKIPFMIVQKSESWSMTTIVRQVEINIPLDDDRFKEPTVTRQKGTSHFHIDLLSPPSFPSSADLAPPPKLANSENIEHPRPEVQSTPSAAVPAEIVNASNFVTSPLEELRRTVPDLRGLKETENQYTLASLLDKVGEKIVDLSLRMPNLISNEEVLESQAGGKPTRENFSYLILARRTTDARVMDEFRVDLESGKTLETGKWKPGDTVPQNDQSQDDLPHVSQKASARKTGGPPLAQGFAAFWLTFYPTNRAEANFRILGQEKIDRHQTIAIAFAQIPGSVRLPGELRFKDKSVPVYYQGVAWVDASDFRIVRLRTDLLQSFDLPVNQLTTNIQFAETPAAGFSSSFWLPLEVDVTVQMNGVMFHDKHIYSKYRSFQAHSRILIP